MLKLYGGALSRWCHGRGTASPYEYELLDMQAKAHKQPEFLAINPMGRVQQLWFFALGSGAILLYLAEKYGKIPLALEQRSCDSVGLICQCHARTAIL